MKRPTLLLALLSFFLILPAAIQAQAPEQGPLYDITIIKVSPDDLADYMEVVGMVKEAAVAANLGPEWGWTIWSRDFEIGIVSQVTDMALLLDEEAWMRAFAGTPGEAMLAAAFEKYEAEVYGTPVSRELWEFEEAWSYVPTEPGIEEVRFAEMMEFWIKPGMEATFEEIAVEIHDFNVEFGGPYPVYAYRTLLGDVGRITYTVLHDSWGDYFGPRSFEEGLARSGMGPKWEALMTRFMDCITESRSSRMALVSDGSYPGAGM